MKIATTACALALVLAGCATPPPGPTPSNAMPAPAHRKVIVFVWDGLRPDSVTPADTPNLVALRDRQGVNFSDNHSAYPTFTMMNASVFATGNYAGGHGFYGNTLYAPGAQGHDSAGKALDYSRPIFTEDYGVLEGLRQHYRGELYLVGTLFQAAHAAGLRTAAVGKSGPAFIQDYADYGTDPSHGDGLGTVFDEKLAFPLAFAKELQAAGYALPKTAPIGYGPGQLALAPDNGDPTAADKAAEVHLADKTTFDPRNPHGSAYSAANEYMMKVYLDFILPRKDPDLSVVWFRNPDSTEHSYGPGSHAYHTALQSQDRMLGLLMQRLKALGLSDRTDVIVVSDHGHTTVAGDPALFPLRAFVGAPDGGARVGAVDPAGYSVSGATRTADLLTRAGITHVYDGSGCLHVPVMSGIRADGTPVYPDRVDADGSVCGKAGQKYTTPSYTIPSPPPADAAIVAANGGSDYLYLLNHDAGKLAAIVRALQSRLPYGAVFVAEHYGAVPGTLPLSLVKVEGAATGARQPDLVVSYEDDPDAVTASNVEAPGTEYQSFSNSRGMHGTFGRRDVHNSLFAAGPDFIAGYVDRCPSGNVDVAPTIAAILGIPLPQATGRPLLEALKASGTHCGEADVTVRTISSSRVDGLRILYPTDPAGGDIDATKSSYQSTLTVRELQAPDGKRYLYFDSAKAQRQ